MTIERIEWAEMSSTERGKVNQAYEQLSKLLNDDTLPEARQVTSEVGEYLDEVRSLLQDALAR